MWAFQSINYDGIALIFSGKEYFVLPKFCVCWVHHFLWLALRGCQNKLPEKENVFKTGSKVSQAWKGAEIWRMAWICCCGEILQSGFKVTSFLADGRINNNFPTWLDGPKLYPQWHLLLKTPEVTKVELFGLSKGKKKLNYETDK